MLVITVILHKQSTEGLCKYRNIKIRKQSIERSRSHQWVKLSYNVLQCVTSVYKNPSNRVEMKVKNHLHFWQAVWLRFTSLCLEEKCRPTEPLFYKHLLYIITNAVFLYNTYQ